MDYYQQSIKDLKVYNAGNSSGAVTVYYNCEYTDKLSNQSTFTE